MKRIRVLRTCTAAVTALAQMAGSFHHVERAQVQDGGQITASLRGGEETGFSSRRWLPHVLLVVLLGIVFAALEETSPYKAAQHFGGSPGDREHARVTDQAFYRLFAAVAI